MRTQQILFKMATKHWISLCVSCGPKVIFKEFASAFNEETVGDFVSSRIEKHSELKFRNVMSISTSNSGMSCPADIPVGVLAERKMLQLSVCLSAEVKDPASETEDAFAVLMKRTDDNLPMKRYQI